MVITKSKINFFASLLQVRSMIKLSVLSINLACVAWALEMAPLHADSVLLALQKCVLVLGDARYFSLRNPFSFSCIMASTYIFFISCCNWNLPVAVYSCSLALLQCRYADEKGMQCCLFHHLCCRKTVTSYEQCGLQVQWRCKGERASICALVKGRHNLFTIEGIANNEDSK